MGELETLYYNRLVSRVRLIRKYRFDVPSARPFIRESACVERQGERKMRLSHRVLWTFILLNN